MGLNSPIAASPDNRPPLNLVVVVDVSGSMDVGGKLDFVRDGLSQTIAELMMQAVGAYALPFRQSGIGPQHAANLATGYCNQRKLSIFGGSNEIQKNIISQMILGL